jgi:uncharacterized protein YdaU (DUF1376 family)
MSKSPAFQFYPKDWLSSQKISLMTPAEEGAYIRLLCYCWNDEDCSIPDDDEMLARMSRLGEEWLKGSSRVVRGCFIAHPTKVRFLTNERLLDERDNQKKWKEKCANGGKKSGEARRIAASMEMKGSSILVEVNSNTASPSSSSSSKQKKRDDIKNISSPKEKFSEIPPWLTKTDWDDFVKHRRALKAPMSVNAWARSLGALSRLRDAGHDPADVINQSIVNGWSGLFPLRNQAGGSNGQRKESSTERYTRLTKNFIQRHGLEEDERAEEKDIAPAVGEDVESFSNF